MASPLHLYMEIVESIEEQMSKRRTVPALILLYSAIDSFAWLINQYKSNSNKVRFTTWVDEWMLKNSSLPCSPIELYSARNGILHHRSSESKLTDEGKARRIVYGINDHDVIDLNEWIAQRGETNIFVAVSLKKLTESFKEGIKNCYLNVEEDSDLKRAVDRRAEKLLVFFPSRAKG